MPWRPGVARGGYNAGLTDEEQAAMEEAVLQQGIGEGVHALYHRLRREMGAGAPSRNEVARFLRVRPETQMARMPRKDKSIAPVLPQGVLSRVFADGMFLPRTAHNTTGVGFKVYRVIVIYIDALTKFMHLHGVFQLVDGRAQSAQTRDGAIEFIKRARAAADNDNLHVERFVTDKGSEWGGAFEGWRSAQATANPGSYSIMKSPGTRKSHNGLCERVVQTTRRLFHARYRAVRRQWDEDDVPLRSRRFDWMDHIEDIEEIYNTGYRQTIKATPIDAINPVVPPTSDELVQRITTAARKRYGNRAVGDGTRIPGFSGSGILSVGNLVRRKIWSDGGGVANLQWSRVDNKTADQNFSQSTYRVSAVFPAQGMRISSYEIEDMAGNSLRGRWNRQQLLLIPEATLQLIDSDSSDEDENGDSAPLVDNTIPQDPRPVQRGNAFRYRVGDDINLAPAFFVPPEAFPGLAPPTFRARVARVTAARARQFPGLGRRRAYGLKLSTGETIYVQRSEIDEDDDAEFAGGD